MRDKNRGTNAIGPNGGTNEQHIGISSEQSRRAKNREKNRETEEKTHEQNRYRQTEGICIDDKEKIYTQTSVTKEEHTDDQSLEMMDESIYGRDDIIKPLSQIETGIQLNSQDSVYGKDDILHETFTQLNTQERIQELEYGMDDTLEDSFDLEAARIDLDVYKIEQSGTPINISIVESDESRDSMHIECETLDERTSTPRKWKKIGAKSNKKQIEPRDLSSLRAQRYPMRNIESPKIHQRRNVECFTREYTPTTRR